MLICILQATEIHSAALLTAILKHKDHENDDGCCCCNNSFAFSASSSWCQGGLQDIRGDVTLVITPTALKVLG